VLLQAGGAAIGDREAPRLAADDEIAGLTRFGIFEASFAEGDSPVTGGAFQSLVGSVSPGLLHGRSPKGAREVAVDVGALPGPAHRLGDVITMTAGGPTLDVRIVGILTGTGPAAFVTTDALAGALQAEPGDEGFLISWAPTTDREAAEARLRDRLAEVGRPHKQAEVRNLERVRTYPRALATFFALLGVGSVAHLCVTAARRGRRDLAVAKALGFTRRQVRAVLAWQATIVIVVGLVAGIPLGIAAGRVTWSAVTRALRMFDEAVVSPWSLVAIALGAVAATNALAFVPGLLAARSSPARELRGE
jgi:putative ABC transport system permease protein